MSGPSESTAFRTIPQTYSAGIMLAAGPDYQVGQRVFGRHGATHEYFTGYVLAVHPDQVFPYLVNVGRGIEPIHVLSSELQSDLPAHAANADDIIHWLLEDADR